MNGTEQNAEVKFRNLNRAVRWIDSVVQRFEMFAGDGQTQMFKGYEQNSSEEERVASHTHNNLEREYFTSSKVRTW